MGYVMKAGLENEVFILCDRLRQLRNRLNLNIEDLALQTGLSYGQIQRLEGSIAKRNNMLHPRGAEGKASTIIMLLIFYAKEISIDLLLNFNLPVAEIPLTKKIGKEIAREKISAIVDQIYEIAKYMD